MIKKDPIFHFSNFHQLFKIFFTILVWTETSSTWRNWRATGTDAGSSMWTCWCAWSCRNTCRGRPRASDGRGEGRKHSVRTANTLSIYIYSAWRRDSRVSQTLERSWTQVKVDAEEYTRFVRHPTTSSSWSWWSESCWMKRRHKPRKALEVSRFYVLVKTRSALSATNSTIPGSIKG